MKNKKEKEIEIKTITIKKENFPDYNSRMLYKKMCESIGHIVEIIE